MNQHTILVAAGLLLQAQVVAAQPFDAQNFKPDADTRGATFVGMPGTTLAPWEWSVGAYLNYANDPLVLYGTDGQRLGSIIGASSGLDLLGAIGITERVELGIDVPLILTQDGDAMVFAPSAPQAGFGVGDVRLTPKIMLLGSRGEEGPFGLSVSAAADLFVPSGRRDDYQGDGSWRGGAKVAAQMRLPHAVMVLGNLGYQVRPDRPVLATDVNDMLTWTLGGTLDVTERVQAVSDLTGQVSVLAGHIDSTEAPIEWLVGAKVRPQKSLFVAGGLGIGLVRGVGSPDYRVFVGTGYQSVAEGPKDQDGDGVLDAADKCPTQPEDLDRFEDADGCPDLDNDGDGIRDVADKCAAEPEDLDQFEDEDGCPDLDNDKDTLADAQDKCPGEPEDLDQFQDEDGCPDPDNDGDLIADAEDKCPGEGEDADQFQDDDGCPDPDNDGDLVFDAQDKCPNQLETINGFEDDDGCPDTGGKVLLTCEKIEIKEKVYFETGSARIESRSFALLDQITAVAKQAGQVTKLRIEGHTDDRGDDASNLKLSQERAEAVRDYLVFHGIDLVRLDAVGFGETKPIASNRSTRGRETNRRVEFVVAERNGECAKAEPARVPAAKQ